VNSLFGRLRMGYVLAESSQLDAWTRFAVEGLGVHADRGERDEVALRIDDRSRRIIVRPGPAEDVVALGWQMDDEAALDLALTRLRHIGVTVEACHGEDARLRGVERFWTFVGPKALRIELFVQPVLTTAPLQMKASGFVTGASGMGHVAIISREPQAMQAFWQSSFDARLSDSIVDTVGGAELDFTFLRLNERHHSLAIASTRGLRMNAQRTSIHHLNIQAATLNDVTDSYLRCRSLGIPIANGIGEHPNDREVSFYVETPSGFDIEVGWNPIVVDAKAEVNWQPVQYRGISRWGHFPENLTLRVKARRVVRGLASLARKEFTVGDGQ
jgi:2,3-dihydroxybiphenyl 1,2-dioxygenase